MAVNSLLAKITLLKTCQLDAPKKCHDNNILKVQLLIVKTIFVVIAQALRVDGEICNPPLALSSFCRRWASYTVSESTVSSKAKPSEFFWPSPCSGERNSVSLWVRCSQPIISEVSRRGRWKRGICIKLSEIDFSMCDKRATIFLRTLRVMYETKYQTFCAIGAQFATSLRNAPSRTPPSRYFWLSV